MIEFINKKIILILLLLCLAPGSLFAFRSVGLGFGPVFNLRGGVPTSYLITGEWNPHKNIGGKLFLGFVNGFWIGTALNASFSVYESKDRKFDWSVNFSIPFIINIYNGVKTAFMGLTAGNSLSLSLDPSCKYYFFVSPVEFVFIPLTWGLFPSTGFTKGFDISLAFSLGFRVRL